MPAVQACCIWRWRASMLRCIVSETTRTSLVGLNCTYSKRPREGGMRGGQVEGLARLDHLGVIGERDVTLPLNT